MGFLSKSHKSFPTELKRLPTGTFTVDADGRIISSTISRSIPEAQIRDIGSQIVGIFAGARKANLPFAELVVQYSAFKITARDMRGGAIIFLAARAFPGAAPA